MVTCSSCSAKLRVPDHMAGRVVRRPKCGQEVAVPISSSGTLAFEVIETGEETSERVKTRKKDDLLQRELNIGLCFSDALEVYKYNFLTLMLTHIVSNILSAIRFGILGRSLIGGLFLMAINGLLRKDRYVEFGDLFGAFDKLLSLLGLIIMQSIIIIGICCFIFPSIIFSILFLYPVSFTVN